MIEAERRAYADRAQHLGDADFYPVPIKELISKDYATKRFANFDAKRASISADIGAGDIPEESPETTHASVMDKDGNAVAYTTTLNLSHGAKMVVTGAGFLLNNEMDYLFGQKKTARMHLVLLAVKPMPLELQTYAQFDDPNHRA